MLSFVSIFGSFSLFSFLSGFRFLTGCTAVRFDSGAKHLTCSLPSEKHHTKAETQTTPPKPGKCQLIVHVIDARDLAARDTDGASDPVVKVRSAEQALQLRIY